MNNQIIEFRLPIYYVLLHCLSHSVDIVNYYTTGIDSLVGPARVSGQVPPDGFHGRLLRRIEGHFVRHNRDILELFLRLGKTFGLDATGQ